MTEYTVKSPDEVINLIREKGYKLLIFDFDGTLADTIQDVAICFNQALKIHGFPEWEIEDIKTLIGGDLETIVTNMIPKNKRTRQSIENVKQTYRQIYLNSDKPNSKPYPGISEMLDQLRHDDVIVTINSNKGQQLLDNMTKQLFNNYIFYKVIGYDERYPSKPDPAGVNQILLYCKAQKGQTIYIGDGNSDRMTAQNADIDFCLTIWDK